ncbi:MAG: 3-mercaptopyruvate sulfurtransferase [Rhodospirillaceae bacterium]|nr:3-mercaptopyruvate sulfurtransferase [Rhodospirillaceae bacterium]|tara:strand:- start:13022 stop:13900 length:879 start_codon:yes stop_codon:yes gene_type:complete
MNKNSINTPNLPGPLIDTAWLSNNIENPKLKILDASWYLPTDMRNPYAEYIDNHIPGSQFFDIEKISETKTNLPHMIPNAKFFSTKMRSLGISCDDSIVVYDTKGVFSSPRAWWMLRIFGHDDVAVLQGGMPAWIASKNNTDNVKKNFPAGNFKAVFNPDLIKNFSDINLNLKTQTEQLIDARSKGRFDGLDPEPRPGLRSGHIPRSINLPYSLLLDKTSMNLLTPEEIKTLAKNAGIDFTKPIITTCGSGISAALLALAFFTIGHTETSVYDGSWAEWGSFSDTPITHDNN